MNSEIKTSMGNVRLDFNNIKLVKLDKKWKPQFLSEYIFLFILSGKGEIIADNTTYSLETNKCFIFYPGTLIEVKDQEKANVECYELSFQLLNGSSNAIKVLQGECFNTNPAILLSQIECLYDLQQKTTCDILCQIEKQMKFYEIVYSIIKESVNPTIQKSTKEKIIESIDYMKNHFNENLSRETLASMAGLSPIYYSHAFKKEIGKSPINYLIEIRMEKAKELLVTSNDRLKSIASFVGYQDEFYFSRIFKKTFGVSPTIYIRNKSYKIFNFQSVFNGHFRALKTAPYSFLDYKADQYFLEIGKTKINLDYQLGFHAVLDKIIEMKPDVIISTDINVEKNDLFRKIAPVVEIPWMDNNWRQHFIQIADTVDKTKNAKLWLEKYDEKAEKASAKIFEEVGEHENVMIVMIWEGTCYLYGRRNIGNVIYNDLKLRPVDGVNHIPYNWRQRISIRELLRCQPDRLLLMVGKDRLSISLLNKLTQHDEFKTLSAVKKGHVYYIDVNPWLEYSAAAQESLIDRAMALFSIQ